MIEQGLEFYDFMGRVWIDGYLKLKEQASGVTSLTPSPDFLHFYAKDKSSVAEFYYKNDAGTERDLSLVAELPASFTASRMVASDASGVLTSLAAQTQGAILFGNGTTQAFDISNLAWNDTTKVLGIGLSNPVFPNGGGLQIYRSDYPRLTLANSTTGFTSADGYGLVGVGLDLYLENREAGNLIFTTTDTERFRVGAVGQLGIGGATYGTAGQYFRSGGALAAPTWADLDHGNLAGLADDDHTQYLLANGSRALSGSLGMTGAPNLGTAVAPVGTAFCTILDLEPSSSSAGIIRWNGSNILHLYGTQNMFVGRNSGNFTLTGGYNVGFGENTLKVLTSGSRNFAMGSDAMRAATTANDGVALGESAAANVTTAGNFVAVGASALSGATTGSSESVAVGTGAAANSNAPYPIVAIGPRALYFATTGYDIVAIGLQAAQYMLTGQQVVAIGNDAARNSTLMDITALGPGAFRGATTASQQGVAVGGEALGSTTISAGGLTGVGHNVGNNDDGFNVTTGTYLTFLGYRAGQSTATQLTNAMALGANAKVGASNVCVIGGTATALKLGISVPAPTNDLSFNGGSTRTWWMERHTTADTPGNSLTIQAGGATVGATDKAGGDLLLKPGVSTGSAESGVQISGCVAGATGTADRTLSTIIQVLGNKLGLFGVAPVVRPAALTTQLTSITHTAPGTPDYALQDLVQNTGFGFVTKDEGNSFLSVVANLQTRMSEIESRFQGLGALN